jgi:adenosine 3'-phospho 5'-phosphosulfate transporter B3
LPCRALNYLNYSTRIVFKSSKVVPTMILGTLLQGRRYSWAEYGGAALLVAGVSLFCLGDVAVAPNFHVAGVGLITLALFADAATSNFEEKKFFRIAQPVSQAEVIFYSSALSAAAAFAVLLPTRELGPAWRHSQANGAVVPLLSAAAVCGYLRQGCAHSFTRICCASCVLTLLSPLRAA